MATQCLGVAYSMLAIWRGCDRTPLLECLRTGLGMSNRKVRELLDDTSTYEGWIVSKVHRLVWRGVASSGGGTFELEGTTFVEEGVYFNWRRGCTQSRGGGLLQLEEGVHAISRRMCTSTGGGGCTSTGGEMRSLHCSQSSQGQRQSVKVRSEAISSRDQFVLVT